MATTHVPEPGPLKEGITVQEILEYAHQCLVESRGDEDKSSTVDDNVYYEGLANAYQDIVEFVTVTPIAKED